MLRVRAGSCGAEGMCTPRRDDVWSGRGYMPHWHTAVSAQTMHWEESRAEREAEGPLHPCRRARGSTPSPSGIACFFKPARSWKGGGARVLHHRRCGRGRGSRLGFMCRGVLAGGKIHAALAQPHFRPAGCAGRSRGRSGGVRNPDGGREEQRLRPWVGVATSAGRHIKLVMVVEGDPVRRGGSPR